MNAFDQVVVLLKLLCCVGPVALYFITLGLVNSQATPRLISARSDFTALSVALAPLVLSPIPLLWASGRLWLLAPAGILLLIALQRLLPSRDSGWVIYNLGARRGQPLVERALRELGWRYESAAGRVCVAERGFTVTFSALPVLRNTTVHVDWHGPRHDRSPLTPLEEALAILLSRDQQLPSLSGCGLLLAGVAMMLLPLWMMARHGEAIAEVVNQLLLM